MSANNKTMLRWAHLPECQSVSQDWIVSLFTNCADVIAGQSPPSETYNENGIGLPFLQGNADFGYMYPKPKTWCTRPQKIAEKNDTLISVRAPVGEVNRADQSYAIGRGVAALRPVSIDTNYLFQAIQRWRFCLQRVAQGTTFDAVTARHFAQLYVGIPIQLEEQEAIARILDSVDRVIKWMQESVEKAVQLRGSLLFSLLSRGVDGHGLVRNTDNSPREFFVSPLGRLPVSWKISTVKEQFALQTGFTLNENRRPHFQRRPYLRVANVQRDYLDLDDIQELEASDDEMATRRLRANDLLVVEGHADRLQIGRCARVTEEAERLTFQNHLFRLRTCNEITPYFGCLWLNSQYALKYWNARCATSSGLNTINQRTLNRLIIPVPKKQEQETISAIIKSQKNHLDALRNKYRQLIDLKKALMHDLLTGKVRVNHAMDKILSSEEA